VRVCDGCLSNPGFASQSKEEGERRVTDPLQQPKKKSSSATKQNSERNLKHKRISTDNTRLVEKKKKNGKTKSGKKWGPSPPISTAPDKKSLVGATVPKKPVLPPNQGGPRHHPSQRLETPIKASDDLTLKSKSEEKRIADAISHAPLAPNPKKNLNKKASEQRREEDTARIRMRMELERLKKATLRFCSTLPPPPQPQKSPNIKNRRGEAPPAPGDNSTTEVQALPLPAPLDNGIAAFFVSTPQLLLNIFSFLSEKDLCMTISLVCRSWHIMSESDGLWVNLSLSLSLSLCVCVLP